MKRVTSLIIAGADVDYVEKSKKATTDKFLTKQTTSILRQGCVPQQFQMTPAILPAGIDLP